MQKKDFSHAVEMTHRDASGSAMPYLLLHVFCFLGFNQVIGYGQKRNLQMLPMVVANYAVAAFVAVLLLFSGTRTFSWTSAAMGAANGLLYVVHLLILIAAFRAAGIGISAAVTNSCVVVPVLVSFLFWLEPMTSHQWIAVAMLPVAMLFMRPGQQGKTSLSFRADGLLAASFLAGGLIASIHKAQQVYCVPESRPLYRAGLFAVAAISSLVYLCAQKISFGRQEIYLGAILGAFNIGSLFFLLIALRHVPTVVLFPVAGCLAIVLNITLAKWLWKERLVFRQIIGIAISVAVIILVNQVKR